MMKDKNLGLTSRCNSIKYALSGIRAMAGEPNAVLHGIATVSVIAAGIVKGISGSQWLAVGIAITLVWVAEAFNTSIERLCDFACRNEWHPAIKTIKDISAGAVLIAAVFSVITGIFVFVF